MYYTLSQMRITRVSHNAGALEGKAKKSCYTLTSPEGLCLHQLTYIVYNSLNAHGTVFLAGFVPMSHLSKTNNFKRSAFELEVHIST